MSALTALTAILIVAASQFADDHGFRKSRRFRAAHRLAHRTLDLRGW